MVANHAASSAMQMRPYKHAQLTVSQIGSPDWPDGSWHFHIPRVVVLSRWSCPHHPQTRHREYDIDRAMLCPRFGTALVFARGQNRRRMVVVSKSLKGGITLVITLHHLLVAVEYKGQGNETVQTHVGSENFVSLSARPKDVDLNIKNLTTPIGRKHLCFAGLAFLESYKSGEGGSLSGRYTLERSPIRPLGASPRSVCLVASGGISTDHEFIV